MSKGDNKVIKRVNDSPLTQEGIFKFLEAIEKLDHDDHGFEVYTITAVQIFKGNSDKAFSAVTRMQALSKLLSNEELPGWAKSKKPDGSVELSGNIYVAAGTVPLIEGKNNFEFGKDELLRKAFQIGKIGVNQEISPRK
jgi:hypothetical protein